VPRRVVASTYVTLDGYIDDSVRSLDGLRVALQPQLDSVAREIGAASGVIVVVDDSPERLAIAAAYELAGPAFDALAQAIMDPRHPIARTVETGAATYDLRPVNPGGPALRTHMPLIARRGDADHVVGVLALAHEVPIDPAVRPRLMAAADRAAVAIEDARPA